MKYTKNTPNKLLNMGFKFSYNHTDEEINYDVYTYPHLQVTVDHTNKELCFDMTFDDESLDIESLDQLAALQQMILSIKKK